MSPDTKAIDQDLKRADKHRRLKELAALLLFATLVMPFAAPCLCVEGAIRGRYTIVLAFSVFSRLAWITYKGKFTFKDYFAYLGIVVAFCIWAESRCGH